MLETDRVQLRIFLEGVLFPYAVNVMVNSTASDSYCDIEIPASPKMVIENLYGVTVHVFYANNRVKEHGISGGQSTMGPTNWPILFQGEVRYVDTTSTPTSKTLRIRCVSTSRYFDQTHIYFLSPDRDENILDFQNRVVFLGNQTYVPNPGDGLLEQKEQFRQKLKATIERFSDPLSGTNPRFLAMSLITADIMRMAGLNAAFRIADSRFKLTQRFGAFIDPDVENILTAEQLDLLVGERSKQLPSYASVREVQNVLTDMMRYDWIYVSQPHLSKAGEDAINDANIRTRGPINSRTEVTRSDILYDSDRTTPAEVTLIEQSFEQVRAERVLADPTPRIVSLRVGPISFYEDYFKGPPYSPTELSKRAITQRVVDKAEAEGLSIQDAFQAVVSSGAIIEPTPSASPSSDATLVNTTSGSSTTPSPSSSVSLMRTVRASLNAELHEYISVPNMEFAQPPRCNVLMPHNMTSNMVSIDHFGGPTRMYGVAKLLKDGPTEYYLSPQSSTFYRVNDENKLEVWSKQYEALNRRNLRRSATKVSR